jgi:hypothetical protein
MKEWREKKRREQPRKLALTPADRICFHSELWAEGHQALSYTAPGFAFTPN